MQFITTLFVSDCSHRSASNGCRCEGQWFFFLVSNKPSNSGLTESMERHPACKECQGDSIDMTIPSAHNFDFQIKISAHRDEEKKQLIKETKKAYQRPGLRISGILTPLRDPIHDVIRSSPRDPGTWTNFFTCSKFVHHHFYKRLLDMFGVGKMKRLFAFGRLN